jgi:phospholipid/cholesterol/gamma-HCH transport system substrate-binding protein
MPGSSKTKWSQLKVGLMSLFAFAILATLIFLMAGSRGLFPRTTEIFTYLGDSSALKEGDPVRLNGILIGKVSAVQLSGSPEPSRIVKITLEVEDEYLDSVPVDSQVRLAAESLLAGKYVNIKRGSSQETVKAGAELPSAESAALEELFEQGNSTLAALQGILRRVDGIVAQIEVGKGTIGRLLVDETLANKIDGIANELLTLSKTLNSTESSLGRLLHEDVLYQDVRGTVAKINTTIDGLNAGQGTAGKLLKDDALYNDLRMTIGDVRELLAGINRGEGTLGKLVKSEELHEQVKGTLGRLDTVLDKVNNGNGTIGMLMNNPQLYESLDGTTRELQGLLKDFRANPAKFLRIRVSLF